MTGAPSASPELTTFEGGMRKVACVGSADFLPSLASIDPRPSALNATTADDIVPPLTLARATDRGAFDADWPQGTDGWTVLPMAGMTLDPEPRFWTLLSVGVETLGFSHDRGLAARDGFGARPGPSPEGRSKATADEDARS